MGRPIPTKGGLALIAAALKPALYLCAMPHAGVMVSGEMRASAVPESAESVMVPPRRRSHVYRFVLQLRELSPWVYRQQHRASQLSPLTTKQQISMFRHQRRLFPPPARRRPIGMRLSKHTNAKTNAIVVLCAW
jgi:hypothetical protein